MTDSQTSNRSPDQDPPHLAPQRVKQLSRKPSELSNTGSESDSLLDLYKQQVDTRASTQGVTSSGKRKMSSTENWQEADLDENNWIHRDKLAQIESKELEEAGFRVRRMSRSSSRGTRDRSVDGKRGESASRSAYRDDKKQRRVSTIPAEEDSDEEPTNWELRTPEEVAGDRELGIDRDSPNSGHHRPSVSRIPVAKTSPLPVPSEFVERDSPLPRSRHGSGGLNNSWAEQGKRIRSGSVGSQILLDDVDDSGASQDNAERATAPISTKSSPVKSKPPSKTTPTGKKTTATTTTATTNRNGSQTRARGASGQSKRPGTSGGISRPTTAHRPEGEAPWIATMYKPDPSLPPDQQIIPTHARKLAQERWEREGKTGSMYDREFNLLNTDEFGQPPAGLQGEADTDNGDAAKQQQEQWPLPLPSPRPDRPKSNSTEHGGYRTMPTISSPKIGATSPSPVPPTVPPTVPPKPEDVIRIQDPPEPTKEKKGCCCIIM